MSHKTKESKPAATAAAAKRSTETKKLVKKERGLARRLRDVEKNPLSGMHRREADDINRQQRRINKNAGIQKAPAHSTLHAWAKQQAFAESGHNATPPFTNNVAQSVDCFTTQTTYSAESVVVKLSQTRQLSLFGKGKQGSGTAAFDNYANTAGGPVCDSMDEVAVHCRPQGIFSTGGAFAMYVIGPVQDTITWDIAGAPTTNNVGATMALLSDTTGSSTTPMPYGQCSQYCGASGVTWNAIPWVNAPPFTAASHTGHVRWVLTGLTVRILNDTPGQLKGGSIVAVSMPHDYYNPGTGLLQTSDQAVFKQFKSYRVFNVDEEVVLNFPTRLQDLAYSHAAVSGASYATLYAAQAAESYAYMDHAMAHIWINGPNNGGDQTYRISITANWAMAGSLVAPLTSAVDHHPQLRPVIEKASTLHQTQPISSGSKGVWDTFAAAAREHGLALARTGVAAAVASGAKALGI